MYAWVKASVECPTLFECMRAVPNHDEGEVEVEQDVKVKVKVSGPAGGGGGEGGSVSFQRAAFDREEEHRTSFMDYTIPS